MSSCGPFHVPTPLPLTFIVAVSNTTAPFVPVHVIVYARDVEIVPSDALYVPADAEDSEAPVFVQPLYELSFAPLHEFATIF